MAIAGTEWAKTDVDTVEIVGADYYWANYRSDAMANDSWRTSIGGT